MSEDVRNKNYIHPWTGIRITHTRLLRFLFEMTSIFYIKIKFIYKMCQIDFILPPMKSILINKRRNWIHQQQHSAHLFFTHTKYIICVLIAASIQYDVQIDSPSPSSYDRQVNYLGVLCNGSTLYQKIMSEQHFVGLFLFLHL